MYVFRPPKCHCGLNERPKRIKFSIFCCHNMKIIICTQNFYTGASWLTWQWQRSFWSVLQTILLRVWCWWCSEECHLEPWCRTVTCSPWRTPHPEEKATDVISVYYYSFRTCKGWALPWGAYKHGSALPGWWSRDTEFQAFFWTYPSCSHVSVVEKLLMFAKLGRKIS